jgi:predicted transglutaminase-like protease
MCLAKAQVQSFIVPAQILFVWQAFKVWEFFDDAFCKNIA